MPEKPASLELLKQEKQIIDDLQQYLQPDVPDDITSFLGRLALLYGVPFGNLVPDVRMLPPESIRFFYVDSNWLEALVDGAFSIGVHSERDIRYDKVMQHAIREATLEASGKLRASLRDEAGTEQEEKPKETPPVRAGFLMRSAIVSGWPGLEICGYSTSNENDETKLKLLRLERLSPDVLLCIFEDIPKLVVLHEPAEDFHFGVTGDGVKLRDPESGVQGEQKVDLPFRGDHNDSDNPDDPDFPARVLRIQTLYQAITEQKDLGKTKANFAVQMIDAADKQAFVTDDQGGA